MENLIGNADVFPILRQWHFFNHAGVCPLPRPAGDAMRKFATEAEDIAYIGTGWYRDIEKLRKSSADLINAAPEEIAFIKNTSEGIATVAGAIDWNPGDRVVTTAIEYPANIYPWMDVAKRFGVELVMIPEETCPDGARRVSIERILEEAKHPRTRLVTLSHVEFASGQRHDIAVVGKFCREHGKLFCVDGIQTTGVLPVDVKAMYIDYLSADGHKWLLSAEGAGIFYCRRELLEKTRPLIVGWMNVINPDDYGSYDFTLKPDAGKFECGSYNVPGLLALRASVDMLRELGIAQISARIRKITDHFIAGLLKKGYRILSPRGKDEFSGIVSFATDRHDHNEIWKTLRREHKVEIAVREGRLRCSPHFYNTEKQLDHLLELLPAG